MNIESEADLLLLLLKRSAPELAAVKITVDFDNRKGFGVRVKPKSQSVSYLYYHNGREWHALREDGVTKSSGIGWRTDELEMVAISIIFIAGQLASDFRSLEKLSDMQELASEREKTYVHSLSSLLDMASESSLHRSSRKWAKEAALELDSMA